MIIPKKANKYKLKKKWRFWRAFKRVFLRKKKKSMFHKLSWVFNNKRVMWHQIYTLYGKCIKHLAYKKTQTKFLFGAKFFQILSFFELRLDILLSRMLLTKSYLKSQILLKNKQVLVNGKVKMRAYITSPGDIIQKIDLRQNKKSKFHSVPSWRKFKWRKWLKRYKKKSQYRKTDRIFILVKKNLIVNFVEINHKIASGIVLRRPLWGEILLENKKRMFRLKRLKKIYFLY